MLCSCCRQRSERVYSNPRIVLCFNLFTENFFEGDGVSGKLGDAFAELLVSHLILVEAEAKR
jgi:hypothetical protein